MWDTDNIFLNGPYAPWREESVAFDLEVEGQIPADLNGAFFQVGANPHFKPENPERYHFFDGDGMVSGVFFRDGRAAHRNRYVQTPGLKLEMQEGRALFGSLFNGSGKPADLATGLPFKNPVNTNLRMFNDRLLVFCEVEAPYALRPDTLETVGSYDFNGGITGPVTAHPKVDPDTGDMLLFSHRGGQITWYRSDLKGTVLDTHVFDTGVHSVIHDYAVTPNYAVFQTNPLHFVVEQAINGNPVLCWDPEKVPVSRFAVMHRVTGDVRWFDMDEQCVISHYFNAYEDGGTVVVDAQRSTPGPFGPTPSELEKYGDNGDYNFWFTRAVSVATRWELDLAGGTVKERAHTDVTGEFPRINDAHTGREHRFGYFTTQRADAEWLFEKIAKCDTRQGRTELMTVDGLIATDEPVFVPREGATAEDDGWVLSIWWDPATDRSEVVIQDAQNFEGAPVARVKVNHRIPFKFHGDWVPAADLDAALNANRV